MAPPAQKGLRRFSTIGSPTARSRNEGRAQNPDPERLSPPRLQPQANPIDTYVKPPAAPRDPSGLLQVAESLGQISPSIMKLAGQMAQNKEEDSQVQLEKRIAEEGTSSIMQQVRQGNPPPEVTTVFGQERLGQAAANEAWTDFQEAISSGSIEPDQVASWWRERETQDLAAMDESAYEKGYLTLSQKFRNRAREAAAEDLGELAFEGKVRTTYKAMSGQYDAAVADGANPQSAAQTFFNQFDANRNFGQIPYKTQQKLALTKAQRLIAENRFDEAKALLEHKRKGPNQNSLLEDPGTQSQALSALGRISRKQERIRIQEQAARSQAELDQYLMENIENGEPLDPIYEVMDGNGNTKVLSREQQEQRQQELFRKRMTQQYRDDTTGEIVVDEEEQFLTELNVVTRGAGFKHDTWFDIMETGKGLANPSTLSQDQIPPQLEQGIELYRRLRASASEYVTDHLDSDTIDFYEQVEIALENPNSAGTEQGRLKNAVFRAIQARSPETPDRISFGSPEYRELRSEVDEVIYNQTGDEHWLPLVGRQPPRNRHYVTDQIMRQARALTRQEGIPKKKAIKRAAEIVDSTHINFRGQVFKRPKGTTKEEAREMLSLATERFAEKYGEQYGIEEDDLTILPYRGSEGVYYIQNNSGELYLQHEEAQISQSDFAELRKAAQERREAERQREIERITQQNRREQAQMAGARDRAEEFDFSENLGELGDSIFDRGRNDGRPTPPPIEEEIEQNRQENQEQEPVTENNNPRSQTAAEIRQRNRRNR